MPPRAEKPRTYEYSTHEPDVVSHEDWARLTTVIEALPTREPRGRKLFAARFPVMGGSQYILFTERFTDAVEIITQNDGTIELPPPQHPKEAPRGARIVAPKPISDIEWNELARQPSYRGNFLCPPRERGRDLAESTEGACFDGGPGLGPVFVLTSRDAVAFEVFARSAETGRLRCVANQLMDV
jgi:hypothetical protein